MPDNYKRDVIFAYIDELGGEESCSEVAVAKFDTGCEGCNLMSKSFFDSACIRKLGDFEPLRDVVKDNETADEQQPEPEQFLKHKRLIHSLWTSCKRRLSQSLRKLTRRSPPPTLVTLDGQPIKVVGILRDTRWRGINDPIGPIHGRMIRFPDKYMRSSPHNEFRVVKNLAYDVVFGLPTINHIQDMMHSEYTVAGALPKEPNDSADYEKHQEDRKTHRKLMRDGEKEKIKAAEKSSTSKTHTTKKSK